MASLQKKGNAWYCQFLYGKKRHTFTVGEVSETEANQWRTRTETLLMRLRQGLIQIPRGIGASDFMLHDGRPPVVDSVIESNRETTLHQLREGYISTFSNGAIEKNTLYTAGIHFDHLEESFGQKFLLSGLVAEKLQEYVNERQKVVSAITIKKELDTFRSVWNWAKRRKWVDQQFPSAGLVYPKTEEKLPFMTWDEINRRIKTGGGAKALWECLFLTVNQVSQLLKYVKAKKAPAWVYPMVACAGHSGARRSEMIRARCEDVDIAAGILTVREKKRAKGICTTRRVPISETLKEALCAQLQRQVGKPYLFGPGERPLSVQSVQKALERALKGSKWQAIKGWHGLRHSFISALASKGIDQRIIDDFVGHQTDSQRRRYRHLYPDVTKKALSSVFS